MGITTDLRVSGQKFQYVPTLRTKAGEIAALKNLHAQVKQRIVPILQITPTISANFATSLAAAWSGRPIILDGIAQAQNGSAKEFNLLFKDLGNSGVPTLPLVETGANPTYVAAVFNARNQFTPGLALRVQLTQVANAQQWLAQAGGSPLETDLIIDCGHVAEIDPQLIAPVAINVLQSAAPTLISWRSVTLSSSAAPKDASLLNHGPNLVPRRDWQLWSTIAPHFPSLHFGDYGIAHRDLTEPPGFAMANATVTPRYTVNDAWLIRKGRSTRGVNGQPMPLQYHGHAQALAADPNFGQVPDCWADAEIAQIAARGGAGKAGSRETWVGLGLNRHISFVCHQLP